jgi:hypothetical protein
MQQIPEGGQPGASDDMDHVVTSMPDDARSGLSETARHGLPMRVLEQGCHRHDDVRTIDHPHVRRGSDGPMSMPWCTLYWAQA